MFLSDRREFLSGMAAFAVVGGRADAADALPVSEIAPGLFVYQAPYEEASAGNFGAIANLGFVIGDQAVAVIDSGGSLAAGQALLAAIRKKTDRPVAYVINTHFHPDHIFGNGAFTGASMVGHQRMTAALNARGDYYLDGLRRDLGSVADGTALIKPDKLVADRLDIDLGNRILQLEAHPTAHTDCDLTVRDQTSGSWFMGDLLFVKRMPTIDGSLRGWLAVLDSLKSRPAARAIPGHGPASLPWPAAGKALTAYLNGLAKAVRAALKKGLTLRQAIGTVGLDLRNDWVLFDDVHPRNVAVAFAELEWE